MATTNLNVRVDENLKKTADTLLNELGLNMSTAITFKTSRSIFCVPAKAFSEVPKVWQPILLGFAT